MEKKETKKKEEKLSTSCSDKKCPVHGDLRVRGRIFEGYVIRKLPKRVVIEFARVVFHPKYERYSKAKTRIHAHLPDCMADKINVNDFIKVGECRPISKMIHFVVLSKERAALAESKEIKLMEEAKIKTEKKEGEKKL